GRNTDQLWRKRQRQADLGSDLLAGDFQGRGSELEMLFGPAAPLESLLGFNHVQEGSTSRQRIIGCPTLQNWKGALPRARSAVEHRRRAPIREAGRKRLTGR